MKFPYKLSHRGPRGQNDSGFARLTRRIRRACEKSALRQQLPHELALARHEAIEREALERLAADPARAFSDLVRQPHLMDNLVLPVKTQRTISVISKTTGVRRVVLAAA